MREETFSRTARHGSTFRLEQPVIDFLAQLQLIVDNCIPTLVMRTKYVRQGTIFRSHTSFFGNVWRDWVVINWGDEGLLPCQIMGFVDLRDLPENFVGSFGGISPITSDIYAIVQYATYLDEEDVDDDTKMFKPLQKNIGGFTGGRVSHLSLLLATVAAFEREIIVIPDLGGPPNCYLEVLSRHKWRNVIIDWFNNGEDEGLSDSTGNSSDIAPNYADGSDASSDESSVQSDLTQDDGSLGE